MYCKEITPTYEAIGKRRRLTGFIGALLDGDTVIHSMEYSTNSQAEHALNDLTHELLMDLFEHGLVDTLPDAVLADPPGDNPMGDEEGDECPDEYTMLMPEGDWIDVEGLRVVAPAGMVVVQIASEAPTSLREDCLNVITQALNNRPAKDMIPELRRVKARLEAAALSRIVALD